MRSTCVFCLLTICLFVTAVRAQYPYIQRPAFADQLGTQVVYDMHADQRGYLWLATDKGLFRFNGRTFTLLPFDKTQGVAVSYLREDSDGKMWCMNFYKEIFRVETDSLKQLAIVQTPQELSANFVNIVLAQQNLWVVTLKGAYSIDKQNGKIKSAIYSSRGVFIAAEKTGKGINLYSSIGWLLTVTGNQQQWYYDGRMYIEMSMVHDGEKNVGGEAGIKRRGSIVMQNGKSAVLPDIQLPKEKYILHFSATGKNEIWACTMEGGYRWDLTTGKTNCLFPNLTVTDVVKDYQGNYWISTLDNGIFICPSLTTIQYHLFTSSSEHDNVSKLSSIPGNRIAAGSSSGKVLLLNKTNFQRFHYDLPPTREIEFFFYDTSNKKIITSRDVLPDNGSKKRVESHYFGKGAIKDPFGNIIIASFNGCYIMRDNYGVPDKLPGEDCRLYKNREIALPNGDAFRTKLLRFKRTNTILGAKDKERFWVAYADDLYEYTYDSTITIIRDASQKPVIATSLQHIAKRKIIAGTSTNGVMVIDNGKVLQHFTKQNGLQSNNIRKCVFQNGHIWVLTDESIQVIDPVSGHITDVIKENSMVNLIINDFLIDEAHLWVATTKGLILKSINTPIASGKILFPSLQVISNGRAVKNGESLGYDTRNIFIQADALHYVSPASLLYRYRLLGSDTTWKLSDPYTSSFVFNRLPFGKYRFEVMAIDANGFYSSDIKILSFVVRPPFWLHWSFLLVAVTIIIFLIIYLLGKWKKELIRKQSVKELLLRSQLTALRAQMTPHFLYNVLNTVQGLVYGNRKSEASALLGNFSDLMRKNLEASDQQFISLEAEIENLRLYLELEKARFDQGFHFDITVVDITDLDTVYVPSMMLQPFAENAVKHGLLHKEGDKKLKIVFEAVTSGIQVTIEDNGIGRKKSMEINSRNKSKPASFATGALAERLLLFSKLYNKEIGYSVTDMEAPNGTPIGTRVIILIPFYETNPSAS